MKIRTIRSLSTPSYIRVGALYVHAVSITSTPAPVPSTQAEALLPREADASNLYVEQLEQHVG
eukprot:1188863-Prorocentrum_minimum.AAC.2